ncbi:hypothetical protein [Acetobacter fallax]|uniref:Secreted protein n=1 Tax=Acetobacter fallax TaxID=1737473 RepID=A0ABX0KFR6_9PROT|nr:hypothetical protein [Acetobacter fallax]NHO33986.1 hypothetical protein [Acetobacter fallax]
MKKKRQAGKCRRTCCVIHSFASGATIFLMVRTVCRFMPLPGHGTPPDILRNIPELAFFWNASICAGQHRRTTGSFRFRDFNPTNRYRRSISYLSDYFPLFDALTR